MLNPIYILNGPSLNLLGKREPDIYGHATLADIRAAANARAKKHKLTIVFRQSNHEGKLVDWIHEAREKGAGLIINAAAFTHTSVALLDALRALGKPIVEVHLSNPLARESFRRHSYVSPVAKGIICGFGMDGYLLAIDALANVLKEGDTAAPATRGRRKK